MKINFFTPDAIGIRGFSCIASEFVINWKKTKGE